MAEWHINLFARVGFGVGSNSAQTTDTGYSAPVWVASAGVLFPASCLCVLPAPPQTFINRKDWPNWTDLRILEQESI